MTRAQSPEHGDGSVPGDAVGSGDLVLQQRRAALEELRTADRIMASALGTLETVSRHQRLDMIGFNTADGLYGDATRSDVGAAISEVNIAQGSLRKALELLGGHAESGWVELETWGLAEGIVDGIFDVFAALKAQRNIAAARGVHGQIRQLFERVRASDPSLADVQPLADWDEGGGMGGMLEELRATWAFNKPAILWRVGVAVFIVLSVLSAMLGLFE